MVFGVSVVALCACSKKVSQQQCDALLDHYAELVAKESMPDASAETIKAEQVREREEARADEGFRDCATQLQPAQYRCAMKAQTPDALEACLE